MMRFHRCRGFGVQSPWAYRFIRYVINEHYPYYGYESLREVVKGISGDTRRLCELYLRIANYCQARRMLDFGPVRTDYGHYFRAGCRRMDVIRVSGDTPAGAYNGILSAFPTVELARIPLTGNCREFYLAVRRKAADGSLIIIEGIRRGREARRFWREITETEPHAVTFDLYYCGIIVFDSKRYKQNYIVNF